MSSSREELEILSRDKLIERGERIGISHAAVLTKPELIDELLIRQAKDRRDPELVTLRGLFGRARDLLASVVEKKLHLPETAALLRALPVEERRPSTRPSAVPTVTLAEIYATQGHKTRALGTLEEVLAHEPDHQAARTLLERLRGANLPAPPLPPEEEEAPIVPDDAPVPTKYDVDECVSIPVNPQMLFVYWEVRDETRAHLERIKPGGTLVLRVVMIEPAWDGPRSTTRDIDIFSSLGDYFVRDLPTPSVVRTAIGWKKNDIFVPVAHSPALESLRNTADGDLAQGLARWTLRGTFPIDPSDADAEAIQRAVTRQQARAMAPLGSS